MVDAELLGTATFAFGAGVATFFSPCAYPLLPGYVGYYLSQADVEDRERRPVGGAALRGIAAGSGVLAVFGALTALAVAVGRAGFERLVLFEPVVGAGLIAFGLLALAGRAPTVRVSLPKRRASVLGFGLFGAVYALAGAGCVLPVVLPVVLGAIAAPPVEGLIVMGAYAGGVSLLMVAATIATGVGVTAGVERFVAYAPYIERLAGAVMVAAGLGQVYLSVVVLDVF